MDLFFKNKKEKKINNFLENFGVLIARVVTQTDENGRTRTRKWLLGRS
jgi:hypothetical protein